MLFFLVWFFKLVFLEIDNINLERHIKQKLSKIISIKNLNNNEIYKVKEKINNTKHDIGVYELDDAVALLYELLKNVSVIMPNNISKISYEHKKLTVFLDDTFSAGQFYSYKNIFLINGINISLDDYQSYQKTNKIDKTDNEQNILNIKWVINIEQSNQL